MGGLPRPPLRAFGAAAGFLVGGFLSLTMGTAVAYEILRKREENKRVIYPKPFSSLIHSISVSFVFILFLFVPLNRFSLQGKFAPPCGACKGKGFHPCKLCRGSSTISWSPIYDPLAINPCLCPTCDGKKLVGLFFLFIRSC